MRRVALVLALSLVPAPAVASPPASGPDTVSPAPGPNTPPSADGEPILVQSGSRMPLLWLLLPGLQVEREDWKLVLFQRGDISITVRPLQLSRDPSAPLHLGAGFLQPRGLVPTPALAQSAGREPGSPDPETGAGSSGSALELSLSLGDPAVPAAQRPSLSLFLATELHEKAGLRSPAQDPDAASFSGAAFLGFALRF